jgi:hypothetical protein
MEPKMSTDSTRTLAIMARHAIACGACITKTRRLLSQPNHLERLALLDGIESCAYRATTKARHRSAAGTPAPVNP